MAGEKEAIDEAITKMAVFAKRLKTVKEAIDEEVLEAEAERED